MLDPEEIGLRIKAARMLRRMTQTELGQRLRDAGLPWRLAGELERGDHPLLALHRVGLATALGVPERWFTAPLEELCPEVGDPALAEQVAELGRKLDRVVELLEAIRKD